MSRRFRICGEISSDLDRSSLCDIEKSSFKCFEIGLKMILPTQVHVLRNPISKFAVCKMCFSPRSYFFFPYSQ